MKLRTAPTRHIGLATIPSSLLRVGSVRRLGSPCRIATRFLARRIVVSCRRYRKTPWSETRASLRGRDVLVRNVPPTTAQRHDVAVSEFENICLSEDIHGLEELVNHGLNELGHRQGPLGLGQAGTLIWVLRRLVLLAKSCGADLKDHQSVFRTLWRVHRSWSPRHRGRVQNTSISRDRIECGSVRLSQNFLF